MTELANLDVMYPLNTRELLIEETRKPSMTKSSVWQYFGVFAEEKHPFLKDYAICYKCMKFLKCVGSTSSLHNHVKSICLSAERSKEMLEEVSSCKFTERFYQIKFN